MRDLIREGINVKQLQEMHRLVEWLLDLPPELDQRFVEAIKKEKDDRIMPYVSSIERLAIEKGREEGIEKGREEGIEKGREEGIEEGREKGIEQGILAGKIQVLQQLLGQRETPTDDLVAMPVDQLHAMIATLKEAIK